MVAFYIADLLAEILQFTLAGDRKGDSFTSASGKSSRSHAVETMNQAAQRAHGVSPKKSFEIQCQKLSKNLLTCSYPIQSFGEQRYTCLVFM